MERWLDTLSEDWPSQPPSRRTSSVYNGSASDLTSSQSRIPRFSGRVSSTLSAPGKEQSRRLFSQQDARTKTPLGESTLSSLNASRQSSRLRSSTPKTEGHQGTFSISEREIGTVQHKAPPVKAGQDEQTPEWKRRLLDGKGDFQERNGLFAPMELENVFRPPTIAVRQPQRAIAPAAVLAKETTKGEADALAVSNSLQGNRTTLPSSMSNEKKQSQNGFEFEDVSAPSASNNDEGSSRSQHAELCNGPQKSAVKADAIGAEDSAENRTGFGSLQHEKISPFFVSKQNTVDGRVDFAAVDMSLNALQENMKNIRQGSKATAPLSRNVSRSNVMRGQDNEPSPKDAQLDELVDQSLPGDLSVGTEAFVANGGFVNLHRGGRSSEGSFQRRSLSPSSSLHQGSIHTFKAEPPLQNPRGAKAAAHRPPQTPRKQDEAGDSSSQPPRSSGSPLKLFSNYDTFTENRLAQQISKFEGVLESDGGLDQNCERTRTLSPSPSPRKAQISKGNPYPQKMNSFGTVDLETQQFSANYSRPLWPSGQQPVDPHSSRKISSQRSKKSTNLSRNPSGRPSSPSEARTIRIEPDKSPGNIKDLGESQQGTMHPGTGKRLPCSPSKDASKKRRKTISPSQGTQDHVPSPTAYREGVLRTVSQGRKRKDARYIDEVQVADPDMLASRQIRHIRRPTYVHHPYPEMNETILDRVGEDRNSLLGIKTLSAFRDSRTSTTKIDPPTQIVAGALATVALSAAQNIAGDSRKPSVTTSDFFKEAQEIMALIRAERRPHSSHNPAETSRGEISDSRNQDFSLVSTRDGISRPPSREGRQPSEDLIKRVADSRVTSHLRKFEDGDDLGLAIPSTLDIDVLQRRNPAALSTTGGKSEDSSEVDIEESDPPNTRILSHKKRAHDDFGGQFGGHIDTADEFMNSQGSSRPSTASEIKTGSSRSSATIHKIAPESVAHLLSEQMADMIFDPHRRIWVKHRGNDGIEGLNIPTQERSSNSSEDLFGDIPDLTVDEMEELGRVKDSIRTQPRNTSVGYDVSVQDHTSKPSPSEAQHLGHMVSIEERPKTSEGKAMPAADNSSAPSKYSNFAWSGPRPGTRATSYGEDLWPTAKAGPQIQEQSASEGQSDSELSDEVEQEFSIFEGRTSPAPIRHSNRSRQARVVTVTFSSPLVRSPIDSLYDDDPRTAMNAMRNSMRDTLMQPDVAGAADGIEDSKTIDRRSSMRRNSLVKPLRIRRPLSRLDEHEEFSCLEVDICRSETKDTLSTPVPAPRSLIMTPANGRRISIGYELSPLPEFTVHQVDRELDGQESNFGTQHRPTAVGCSLSITAQSLVKHLTDLEPYEPYWDCLRAINLSDRNLTSLHMLEGFCSSVEMLTVSSNQISDLEGIPATVRDLRIPRNNLSDLAAWDCLQHLQYLDVSGNNLRSLLGLRTLVHLRSLKADDNSIESLDGIEHLDGLLALSVAGNALRTVDFHGFHW